MRQNTGYQQAAVTSSGEIIAIFADDDDYIVSVVSQDDAPCFSFPLADLATVIDMLQRTLDSLSEADAL